MLFRSVALVSKSNPTRIKSPVIVFAGKETDHEFALPGDTLAAVCTKETVAAVEEEEPDEATIVSDKLAVPVPLPLVALSPTFEALDAAGVPEIKPVAVFIDKPAGSPLALKLVGELVAVIW